MPKCKINGFEVEVAQGQTIIQAYMKLKKDIAHYCWHPGLSVAGVCRLCMVEIEGMPKLQIACNTEVREGMVINNNSEKVKDAVKWGLDFHLINHPLDCPICDQAGECGLQDQYMAFGKYDPEMAEPKVKKHKVVDLGPTVVLDSERCILCSRCVRFTDEVSKTNELGIFNRGDRSEIGTFDGKPLDNNYSLNTVDICPVGALTSKDFRFRQRVWYLKETDSICPGCSTGCNTKVYYNEEGLWRTKPRVNHDVNGYWMCDEGRNTYKFVNVKNRLLKARSVQNGQWVEEDAGAAVKALHSQLSRHIESKGAESVALVLTGQYTTEEYEDLVQAFATQMGVTQIYHWINNPEQLEDFDGLLFRGDKNPNTKGLRKVLGAHKISAPWSDLESKLSSGKIEFLVVAGPENQAVYPDLKQKVESFSKVKSLAWFTAGPVEGLKNSMAGVWQIPLKTYIEKEGSFINHAGLEQKIKKGLTIVAGALTLSEVSQLIVGKPLSFSGRPEYVKDLKTNYFTAVRGAL